MKKIKTLLAAAMLTLFAGLFTGCDVLGDVMGTNKITFTVVDDSARHIGRSRFIFTAEECNQAWVGTGKDHYLFNSDVNNPYPTLNYETGKITLDVTKYFEEGKIYKLTLLLVDNDEGLAYFVDTPNNILKKQYETDKSYSIFMPKKGTDYVIKLTEVLTKPTGYKDEYNFEFSKK